MKYPQSMTNKQEPTQKTGKGFEFPILTREAFMNLLRKVTKGKGSTPDRPEK
jgi:hypothetical protein